MKYLQLVQTLGSTHCLIGMRPGPPSPLREPSVDKQPKVLNDDSQMSTSLTTHKPDADTFIPGSDELTDIEKQRPITTESLTNKEKLASDLAVIQVPTYHSIFNKEYPNGGFRAWLIVFGVSIYPLMSHLQVAHYLKT